MAPGRKREHLSYEENICHPYACAIQKCLKRNNYNEKRCKEVIQQWRECLNNVTPPDPASAAEQKNESTSESTPS